jgi:hypothetical protein
MLRDDQEVIPDFSAEAVLGLNFLMAGLRRFDADKLRGGGLPQLKP